MQHFIAGEGHDNWTEQPSTILGESTGFEKKLLTKKLAGSFRCQFPFSAEIA